MSAQETYGDEARPRVGFFTDTSVCIGCKACEVACKNWNQLPARGEGGAELTMSGLSYDNTVRLSGTTWRHVKFIEQFDSPYTSGSSTRRKNALSPPTGPSGSAP